MEALDTILFCLSLCMKVFGVYMGVMAVFTLLRPRRYPHAAPRTRFAVVVAARNEEAVIGQLIRNVRAQEYPPELVDIYVVPNNCTDHTAEAAAAAGAKILSCLAPVHNKGDVLHQSLGQLLPMGYDAFLVLDADNTISPGYLAQMNDAFAAGAKVCKSRIRAANPTASGIAGCYGLYNTSFDIIWNRPRSALGLSARLIGSGFAVHREVLEALGGWNTATITEDMEFASQLAVAGYQVAWLPDAINYDEEPLDFRTSLHQRKRWTSGVMQVAKTRLGHMWGARCPRPMLRWDLSMYLLSPFAQAISALLMLSGVLTSALTGDYLGVLAWLGSLLLSWLGSMVLAAALCLLGGYGLKGMGPTIAMFPIFTATWMPLQVISLFHDTKSWRTVVHRGPASAAVSRG